jgi:hypothetical protein
LIIQTCQGGTVAPDQGGLAPALERTSLFEKPLFSFNQKYWGGYIADHSYLSCTSSSASPD